MCSSAPPANCPGSASPPPAPRGFSRLRACPHCCAAGTTPPSPSPSPPGRGEGVRGQGDSVRGVTDESAPADAPPAAGPKHPLRFAFGTLTVLPVRVGRWDREAARAGMACAPVVGLVVGLAAAALGGALLVLGGGALLPAVAAAALPAP